MDISKLRVGDKVTLTDEVINYWNYSSKTQIIERVTKENDREPLGMTKEGKHWKHDFFIFEKIQRGTMKENKVKEAIKEIDLFDILEF